MQSDPVGESVEVERQQRAEERRRYWEEKHLEPKWSEDIHFGIFSGDVSDLESFADGVQLNTAQVIYDMEARLSLYSMINGARVIDFGCGRGDLLIDMGLLLPGFHGVGIDLASCAIEKAKKRLEAAKGELVGALEFKQGGVELLQSMRGEGKLYDLMVIRDTYYLLFEDEQRLLWEVASALLKEDGMVYIADLAVHKDFEQTIKEPLVQRQSGGRAIRWWSEAEGRTIFSLDRQAKEVGFGRAGPEVVNEWAVRDSYKAAGRLFGNGATGSAYATLARIADQRTEGGAALPYVRLWYERKVGRTSYPAPKGVGLELEDALGFGGEEPILDRGHWIFPRGKWSLLIGRSGVGKSTLLKYLAGWRRKKSVRRIGSEGDRVFVLSQKPDLIEELSVEENLRLYQGDSRRTDVYQDIVKMLGFDQSLLCRRADKSLSGGERQRVALGQALVAEPDLLILDEPFSGVDQARKIHLLQRLRELQGSRDWRGTVICVDHDFQVVARFFDHLFELRGGNVYELQPC